MLGSTSVCLLIICIAIGMRLRETTIVMKLIGMRSFHFSVPALGVMMNYKTNSFEEGKKPRILHDSKKILGFILEQH